METTQNTLSSVVPSGWDAILAGRKTGIFYLHDQEPMALKLVRAIQTAAQELKSRVAEQTGKQELEGLVSLDDPTVIGRIIGLFTAEHEMTRGPGITIRRVTKTEHDLIKPQVKSERLRDANGNWYDKIDEEDRIAKTLATAILDPAVPGDSLAEKAQWIRDNLSPLQINELINASVDLDGFNLRRIEEKVKN